MICFWIWPFERSFFIILMNKGFFSDKTLMTRRSISFCLSAVSVSGPVFSLYAWKQAHWDGCSFQRGVLNSAVTHSFQRLELINSLLSICTAVSVCEGWVSLSSWCHRRFFSLVWHNYPLNPNFRLCFVSAKVPLSTKQVFWLLLII